MSGGGALIKFPLLVPSVFRDDQIAADVVLDIVYSLVYII